MLNAQYQTIKNAATITGLSQLYIRTGCRNGTIPHLRCGNRYMVNVDAMRRELDEESRKTKGSAQ